MILTQTALPAAPAAAPAAPAAQEMAVRRIHGVVEFLTDSLDKYLPPVVSNIIVKLSMLALVVVAAWVAIRIVRVLVKDVGLRMLESKMGERPMARARTLSHLFYGLLKYVIIFFAFIYALLINGIDPTPFLGGAAIIGLAVSFGSQDLVKDIMTGVFVMMEDQFTIGEYIQVADTAGVVVKMTVRIVTIRDSEGNLHSIPYRNITTVTNASRTGAPMVMDVFLAKPADEAKATALVEQALSALARELDPIISSYKVTGIINSGTPYAAVRVNLECRPNCAAFVQAEAAAHVKRAFADAAIPLADDRIRFFGRPLQAVAEEDGQDAQAGEPAGVKRS